ncbi:MAG TPA: acyl-ACP--UDP-N-acetylglucosamine O-acyltransferase [Candidatus Saccharimonadales bacterium]|nr:acyl-ACP--UDP-N-acetylglucosamine O-acyltransferase [Candidatus Saccharimonadales bacterium]
MAIHPSAVVDAKARVPESCTVGPFCLIGADVELGEHCELISHVVLTGPTKLGSHNRIHPFAVVGMGPQDLSFKGEPTRLEIGDHNEIREYVTIHRGTVKGGGLTTVGSNCLIMAYAHIAHDCHIGDNVIMANAATLAGHVTVEEWAVVGALCPIHQFVTVGAHSYIGGGTTITQNVMPFSKTCAVRDVHAYGANSVGLERRGFSKERVQKIQKAFRVLLAAKLNTTQALERIASEGEMSEDVKSLVEFIRKSERGVLK